MSAYEKYADIFLSSLAGEMSGLNKEQFIAICKSKFPDEAAFAKEMEVMTAQVEKQIEMVQAQLKPNQILAFGYPVEVSHGPMN